MSSTNNNKYPVFTVNKGKETLRATFSEEGKGILITYINDDGAQIGLYKNGMEINIFSEAPGGFLGGYGTAYERLGPSLRNKLPETWKKMLGIWLTSKKERIALENKLFLEEEDYEYLEANYPILDSNDIAKIQFADLFVPDSRAKKDIKYW